MHPTLFTTPRLGLHIQASAQATRWRSASYAPLVVHCWPVPTTTPCSEPSEYASGVALVLFDELRLRMMECRLVVQALSSETDLNISGLERDLHSAQEAARHACQAARLGRQGASQDLGPRSAASRSRPESITEWHAAEVPDVSMSVDTAPTLGDLLERTLWQLPAHDHAEDAAAVRPKCSSTVLLTGAECPRTAIYLGAGRFGAHCRRHLTPKERTQVREYRQKLAAELARFHDELRRRRRRVGEAITEHWLQHRESRREWVDKLSSAAGPLQ